MTQAAVPTVVAMLICDQIITEAGTNKKSLIGIFENFNWPTFPAPIPRISIYVKLADAVGKYQFKLRLVKLTDESLVAEIALDAEIKNAGKYSELALTMANLIFPETGTYEFQLYAGDIYLQRITMRASLLQGGQQWQPPRQPQ